MNTKTKHWLFFSLTALFAVLVTIVMYAVLWSDMSESERALGVALLPRAIAYGSLALIIMFLVSSQFVSYVFKHYIIPVEKLAEETQLISVANANYRINTIGSEEVKHLTAVINELGEKHVSLKTDVQKIVQRSRMELSEEKKRLETLMTQIPGGVLVCNLDGRVLLYNHMAQEILKPSDEKNGKMDSIGLIGLGRSIFGFMDREPILHSLNYLQNRIYEGDSDPSFDFITTRKGEQFIKVNIAPVKGDDKRDINGYILTIEDITRKIKEESQRDIFLQSLTIGLQIELSKIHDAAQLLYTKKELKGDEAKLQVRTIDDSAQVLLDQIDMVAEQHAGRLKNRKNEDFLLANDLLSVLKENIWSKFKIKVNVILEESLWLNINSYTIIRGVMYLMGQLKIHIDLQEVDLSLIHKDDIAQLKVHWEGGAVKIKRLEEWRKCPLMLGSKGAEVSLDNIMVGRGELTTGDSSEEKSDYVCFNLDVEKPETVWKVHTHKIHRPVYYEFDLFEQKAQSSDLAEIPLDELTYLVFDTETTGLNPSEGDEIISIAGIRIIKGHMRYEEIFDEMVDPRRNIPLESLKIHEIYPDMLIGKPLIDSVLPQFHQYAEGSVLVAHNAAFDMRFLALKEEQCGVKFTNPVLDTLHLSAIVHPLQESHNLEDIAERFGLDIIGRHTALGDAIVTGEIFLKLVPLLNDMGINTLKDAWEASAKTRYADISF